jgi:hypothetical protein
MWRKRLQLLDRVWGLKRNTAHWKADPRVDEGDEKVRDDVADQQQQAREQHHAHDHRIVPIQDRVQAEEAEPVDIEDRLDEKGATDQQRDVLAEGGGDGDQRVAQGMAGDGPAEGHALGNRRADVVRRQVVHQVVLQQQRDQREAADQVADQRQQRVPQQIERDLPQGPRSCKLVADEAAHGKPLQAHGEEQDQQRTQGVAGDRVADEDQHEVMLSTKVRCRIALRTPSGIHTA